MADDIEYLKNYHNDKLYVNTSSQGAYATIITEGENTLSEFDITEKSRISVKAFYVKQKEDFNSFKITRLKKLGNGDWIEADSISFSKFDASKMMQLVSVMSSLDLKDAEKTKLDLGRITSLGNLEALLKSSGGSGILQSLSNSKSLERDIIAIEAKRDSLRQFEEMLVGDCSEPEWQSYFEKNEWIFGYGLEYVFLSKVGEKLEATTTGSSFDTGGKRTDALMRTQAEVSQYALIEIKKSNTDLLQMTPYRTAVWSPSSELTSGIAQIQKTAHDFSKDRFKDYLKDEHGNETGELVFSTMPKTFFIIGNSKELLNNPDKIACFELFRRNIVSPAILTFDELYFRAKLIIENLQEDAIKPVPQSHPNTPPPHPRR